MEDGGRETACVTGNTVLFRAIKHRAVMGADWRKLLVAAWIPSWAIRSDRPKGGWGGGFRGTGRR